MARVTHERKVPFFTNATVWDLLYTGGLKGNGTGEGSATAVRCGGCGRLALVCQVKAGCLSLLGGWIGVIVGALAIGGLVFGETWRVCSGVHALWRGHTQPPSAP